MTNPQCPTPQDREAAWNHLVAECPWTAKDEYYKKNPIKSKTYVAFLSGIAYARSNATVTPDSSTSVLDTPAPPLPLSKVIKQEGWDSELNELEERAQEYAEEHYPEGTQPDRGIAYLSFLAGAQSERERLTGDLMAISTEAADYRERCVGKDACIAELEKEVGRLQKAIKLMIAQAGAGEPLESCVLVINTGKAALAGECLGRLR